MDEVAELVAACLGERPVQIQLSPAVPRYAGAGPFTATAAELEALARESLDPGSLRGDRDMWLDLLMSHVIEPQLAELGMCFVYDYPASQAALSRIASGDGDGGAAFRAVCRWDGAG